MFPLSDLSSPGFGPHLQDLSTGSCPHGGGHGLGNARERPLAAICTGESTTVLYVGDGTGSTGSGGGQQGLCVGRALAVLSPCSPS